MTKSLDQAETLRAWAEKRRHTHGAMWQSRAGRQAPQVIAIGGGKGGVGKTVLAANLSVALANSGARVLAMDADLGLANLDLAFGVTPRRTLVDVIEGTARLEEVLVPAPGGVQLLPAASGRYELASLNARARAALLDAIDRLGDCFDALLIDTATGIGGNAVHFAGAAQAVVVVATAEPTSIADAYAFVKVLRTQCGIKQAHFVASMVKSRREGERLYDKLATLSDRFLGVDLSYLGSIHADPAVPRSVRAGVPLLMHAPRCEASYDVEAIARKLLRLEGLTDGGIRLFWRRILSEVAA